MADSLTASMVDSIRSAAKKLAGFPRRQFQAEMTVKYCHGSARHAETVFGWGRDAVKKGLRELHSGERYPDHFSARGRRKTEGRFPEIAQHIHALVDALQWWWNDRQAAYPGVRRLLINLDNGPEINSSRTQFMKRLIEFSDRQRLILELAYYPPYHSKYNPIERCWGILENHWNGALLRSIDTALKWAKTMTWRGVAPLVHLMERVYDKGVRISRAAFRPLAARLQRSTTLPKWSLVIEPQAE